MKSISIFAGLLAFSIFSVSAQKTIKVRFKDLPVNGSQGNGVAPLYQYESDTFYYRGKSYHVKIPDSLKNKHSAFGWEFFDGVKNNPAPSVFIIMVSHYDSDHSWFLADKNFNLDLTDDGSPVPFGEKDSVTIWLTPDGSNQPTHGLAYKHISYVDSAQRKDIEDVFMNHFNGTNNKILNSGFWLDSYDLEARLSQVLLNGKKYVVGIYDGTNDGKYTLNNVWDKILIKEPGQKMVFNESRGAVELRDTTLIKVGNDVYRMTGIDSFGRWVKLQRSNLPYEKLNEGDMLPDYDIFTLDSSKTKAYTYFSRDKYNLISFWGTWCHGCVEGLPREKALAEKYKDRLNVVSFNVGDSISTAKKFMADQNITWPVLLTNGKMMDDVYLDYFPYMVLIDKDFRVVRFGIWYKEIDDILAKAK